MYLGVDVGGTKTLVAVLDDRGVILEQERFATPKKYVEFIKELEKIQDKLKPHDFKAGAIGIPSTKIKRNEGIAIGFGNLPWKNVAIQKDLESIFKCPFAVENDAKLGCLSESMLLKDKFSKIVYLTVSTGIGYALVENGKIDTSIGDGGGRTIMLDYKGNLTPWEDFASGRAIVKIYGKKAHDIDDKETWQSISRNLAKGLIHLISIIQPEVVVIGGSVGIYFDRYGKLLMAELKKYDLPLVKLPELRGAQRPEEAVIFGCYDLAKQAYNHG